MTQRDKADLAVSIESARQAKSILEHPIFIAAINSLTEVAQEKFKGLGFTDIQEMQECNIRLNLIEEFESNIVTIIESGNAAFRTLEKIQNFEQEMKK